MNLPPHFTISRRVVLTFLRSGLSRKECAWILCCSKHTVDTHVENLKKKEKADNCDQLLCDCLEKGWIRSLSKEEKEYYRNLADSNEKNFVQRLRDDQIEWQKFHDELYG